jgi:Opioid growth factor receptor (OGFr) conserved region
MNVSSSAASYAGPLHAFLAGAGHDGRGRWAADVLAFSDAELEQVHDYIQWLFPLPTRSSAQPDAPVLTEAESDAIQADRRATDTLAQAADRMLRFYQGTDAWLTAYDHNHLRITRILRSLGLLIGPDAARRFHRAVLDRHEAAGAPVNTDTLRFWAAAADQQG